MALNVIMLGASRSGKTSILASMLNNVRKNDDKHKIHPYFSVRDCSDYNGLDEDTKSKVNLQAIVDDMKDFAKSFMLGNYVPKMGSLIGTQDSFDYKFDVSYKENGVISNDKMTILLKDIPGEICSNSDNEKNLMLSELVKESQVMIVAVDVPSLMYAKERGRASLNTIINCTEIVRDAIEDLGLNCYDGISGLSEESKNAKLKELLRMVIFVPIKCEYWLQQGRGGEIVTLIKDVYEDAINASKCYNNIQVMVLPVETIGTCLFDHHSDEENSKVLEYGTEPKNKNYVWEDKNTSTGMHRCRCEQINENQVRLKNGIIYDKRPNDVLIDPKDIKVYPYCYERNNIIPYTWFKAVSDKYEPKYCELLLGILLKFTFMDFAKRNGYSIRSIYTDIIKQLDGNQSWFKKMIMHLRETTFWQSRKTARKFLNNIIVMEKEGVLDMYHIAYLVYKEDGKNMIQEK